MHKKILFVLFATLLVDMIGFGMIIPVLPAILTDASSPSFLLGGYSQGMQYFIAGLITGIWGLMQFVSSPISGELSDVYGRKKLLLVGVGVLSVAQVIFGFGVVIGSLAVLFVSRIVAGLAGSNFTIVQASIADITDPKDRAKNFGLIGVAVGVGFILGPMLGGLIAHSTGNAAAPFWAAGLLGVFNFISLIFFLPETNKHIHEQRKFTFLKGIHNIKAAFNDVDARPVYGASFFYVAGFSFFTSFSGILLVAKHGFSEAAIGTFFAAIGVWIIITQGFILRILSRKYSERSILRYSIIVIACGLAAYPFMPNPTYLYLILPFIAIPQGLSMANMGALISKGVSSQKQGVALGINSSLGALAQGVIPLFAGAGSGLLAIQAPFIMGGVFMFIAWALLFAPRPKIS